MVTGGDRSVSLEYDIVTQTVTLRYDFRLDRCLVYDAKRTTIYQRAAAAATLVRVTRTVLQMTEKTTWQGRTGCRPPTGEREIASQRGADSMKLLTIPLHSTPVSTVRNQTSSSLSSNTERTNKQAFNRTNKRHSTTTCIHNC
ncbi:hypothetical protein CBL_14199 [Carabus blaptoides fortunei]